MATSNSAITDTGIFGLDIFVAHQTKLLYQVLINIIGCQYVP